MALRFCDVLEAVERGLNLVLPCNVLEGVTGLPGLVVVAVGGSGGRELWRKGTHHVNALSRGHVSAEICLVLGLLWLSPLFVETSIERVGDLIKEKLQEPNLNS